MKKDAKRSHNSLAPGNAPKQSDLASPYFTQYRKQWPKRQPDLQNKRFDDEVKDLSNEPEVLSLTKAPAGNIQIVKATPKHSIDKAVIDDKYLWIIRVDDVKLALENGTLGKQTMRGRLAHTNLAGSADAHCGGELWFKSGQAIYFNGMSSRFRARDPIELKDIANAFVDAGFDVCSFGWDHEKNAPSAVLRDEEDQWIRTSS